MTILDIQSNFWLYWFVLYGIIYGRLFYSRYEYGLVIASGGDGTVSAAATALIETPIPLGIIGRRTANAFASAFGIPTDLESACHVITPMSTLHQR